MSLAVNTLSLLLNNRMLSDIEYKIQVIDNRMLALTRSVYNGQMPLIQAHFVENELMERKKELEAKHEAVKLMFEGAQKAAKESAKDGFKLNALA